MDEFIEGFDSDKIESALIWDMVSSPETIEDIRRIVQPRMFRNRHLRDAFSSLLRMEDDGEEVDVISMRNAIDKDAFSLVVAQTASGKASQFAARSHMNMVRNSFFYRCAFMFGSKLVEESSRLDALPEKIMSDARAFCADLESVFGSPSSCTIGQAVDSFGEGIKETNVKRAKGLPTCVPTGFRFLDRCFLGGLKGGDVLYIAARPGVGKTAVMLSMMRSAAEAGHRVKLWSLEMTAEQLAERVMYSLGGLTPGEKLSGHVDWSGRWKSARDTCAKWGIVIEDSVYDIENIATDITVSYQRGECDIAFVDYFQLIGSSSRLIKTEERLAEMSRRLKLLALSKKIPIVINSQLNRESMAEHRAPELHDMRGSGAMEQDADRVVILYTADQEGRRMLKMKIAKNREGGHLGEVATLKPNETYTVFDEISEDMPTAESTHEEKWAEEIRTAAEQAQMDLDNFPF